MNVQQKINDEKLLNILNPKEANKDFKITIRFKRSYSSKYEKAVELAKENQFFMDEGKGDSYTIYVSFSPDQVDKLHQLFDLVKDFPSTKLYLNHKYIPYIQDLWLFLMWFYKVK